MRGREVFELEGSTPPPLGVPGIGTQTSRFLSTFANPLMHLSNFLSIFKLEGVGRLSPKRQDRAFTDLTEAAEGDKYELVTVGYRVLLRAQRFVYSPSS